MPPLPIEAWDRITIGTIMMAGLICGTYIAKLLITRYWDYKEKKRKK
jgi:hypothetical protein